MKFNLNDLNPPAWFEHDSGARICLRVASAKDLDDIRKKTTTRKREFRRGQRFEYEEVNEQKQSELTWQFCIVDWHGLFDHDDKQIECSDENKVLLMQNSPVFSNWVIECLELLNEDNVERVESAEKN